jgi:hypothetical protein
MAIWPALPELPEWSAAEAVFQASPLRQQLQPAVSVVLQRSSPPRS